jgi:hypothetical protein
MVEEEEPMEGKANGKLQIIKEAFFGITAPEME